MTFQYVGRGDASYVNSFYLDINANGSYEASEELFRGGATTSCFGSPSVVPNCDKKSGGFAGGQNEFSFALDAGQIKFAYLTNVAAGGEFLLENSGAGLGNPDTTDAGTAGYFLGVDPYLATSPFQASGSAVYAGLTDRSGEVDHDFQDLGVRISVVPEPGGLALVLAAFGGLALTRKRAQR